MVANSQEKHWGQIMGGTEATIDDLRGAVRANIRVTIDITANHKDRVGVDVAWNQESVNDPRRDSMCVHTHKCTYTHTGKSDMII